MSDTKFTDASMGYEVFRKSTGESKGFQPDHRIKNWSAESYEFVRMSWGEYRRKEGMDEEGPYWGPSEPCDGERFEDMAAKLSNLEEENKELWILLTEAVSQSKNPNVYAKDLGELINTGLGVIAKSKGKRKV